MSTTKTKQKLLLLVLDGWGLYKEYPGNAIALAKTPYFDYLWQTMPTAVLEASGEAVGLPEGQMGTSEVNHFTIGAGRVIFQDLVRINRSIADNSFNKNQAFVSCFDQVKHYGSTLHIVGLLSDGGVHSHQDHIHALLDAAAQSGVQRVLIHVITDGRDTSPRGGSMYLQKLQAYTEQLGIGAVASVGGRYFAMDRDHNWNRTDKYLSMLLQGDAPRFSSARKIIEASYEQDITDEFIEPALVEPPTGESYSFQPNDAVIIANFRTDRPRQLVERLLQAEENKITQNLMLTTMCNYNSEYNVQVAFPPDEKVISLGQLISEAGLKQLRTTETEKFIHMTYFINGKRENPFPGEEHKLFPSNSDIPTHDHKPEMRTPEIAAGIVEALQENTYDVIFCNLCNADMLGHTGNIEATVIGCQTVDLALASIIPEAQKQGFAVIITADHGNADIMTDEETDEPMTSHSLNPVPFILVSDQYPKLNRSSGALEDIAPTILRILGLSEPQSMTGTSLVDY